MSAVLKLNEPNLRIPLAASYNTRDFSVSVTRDQRKINSFYQVAQNFLTGKNTVYLSPRPAIGDSGSEFAATSGDVPYLIVGVSVNALTANTWGVFRDASNVTKVINTASSNTVVTDANRYPVYVDKTLVSGVETVVLQLRHTSGDLAAVQKVFFSSSIGTWTEITDGDFTGNKPHGKMEFMDGYAFYLNSDNKVYNSDLNSLANWTATSYIQKQIEQDRPMGLMRLGRVILACGATTMEGFYNAGNTTGSPLGRIPQLSQRVGLGVLSQLPTAGIRHYYTKALGKLYFLGSVEVGSSAARGSTGLYVFDGSSVSKVSNAAIDGMLSWNIGSASTHVCTINFLGQVGIAIANSTFTATTQNWLIYFPQWNEWFEWTSSYAQFANNGSYFLGIGGTASYRDIGDISLSGTDGNSNAFTMTHQFKLPRTGSQRNRMHFAGVIADTAASGSINISFSDDDGQSFSTARPIDATSITKQIYRCGSYKGDRLVKLEQTGSFTRLESFIARVE